MWHFYSLVWLLTPNETSEVILHLLSHRFSLTFLMKKSRFRFASTSGSHSRPVHNKQLLLLRCKFLLVNICRRKHHNCCLSKLLRVNICIREYCHGSAWHALFEIEVGKMLANNCRIIKILQLLIVQIVDYSKASSFESEYAI